MQTKSLDLTQCDIKFAKEGRLEGYLSVFGGVDSYGDTIFKGAYEATLTEQKHTMPMLLNHDSLGVPVGVWRELAEDEHGLRAVGEFTKGNSQADQVFAAVKHGAMSGLSIGYKAIKAEPNETGGEDLHEIKLREGSVVTFPADDSARIDTVKFEPLESIKDLEYCLRDVGVSHAKAKILVSQFKDICLRDVDDNLNRMKELEAELGAIKASIAGKARLDRIDQLIHGGSK